MPQKPVSGTHEVRIRAINGEGRVQTYEPRDIFSDSATGQQKMTIKVT